MELFADCLHCGIGGCSVDMSDYPKSVGIICVTCGTNYLYKNDYGKWETGKEKMARMEKHYTCKRCKKDIVVYSDKLQPNTKWCEDCNPVNKTREVRPHHRNNGGLKTNSPWRIGVNYKKKEGK